MDGYDVAMHVADALHELGFPWSQIPDEGLKIVDRFASEDVKEKNDLQAMREFFDEARKEKRREDAIDFDNQFAPSEYTVVDRLIHAFEDLAGNMPWVAEPIYDVLDDYEAYLKSVKAPRKLRERLKRITHSISDIEMRASGRG
jgi:hypothetical protein